MHQVQIIKVGMIIKVIYYDNGQYVQMEGKVAKINFDTKMIQIVKIKLNLNNIIDIYIINT